MHSSMISKHIIIVVDRARVLNSFCFHLIFGFCCSRSVLNESNWSLVSSSISRVLSNLYLDFLLYLYILIYSSLLSVISSSFIDVVSNPWKQNCARSLGELVSFSLIFFSFLLLFSSLLIFCMSIKIYWKNNNCISMYTWLIVMHIFISRRYLICANNRC